MHKLTILFLSFSFSLCGMDVPQEEPSLSILPLELVHKIVLHSDMQELGRFGQTCRKNNTLFRDWVLCKYPNDSACTSIMCSFLNDPSNFDACTRALVFYAKEYKANLGNNDEKAQHARAIFDHFWQRPGLRYGAVMSVMENNNATFDDCLKMYAGQYGDEEMGQLASLNTFLAKKMKAAAEKVTSCKLKELLIEKDVVAVKTLLLADNLLFNPNWSGYKWGRDRDKYNFNYLNGDYRQATVLECACELGRFDILDQLIRSSGRNCVREVIKSLIQCANVQLLEALITKNYEIALKQRFSIWLDALKHRFSIWSDPLKKPSDYTPESMVPIFEKIISLLFEHIDLCDEYGRSLLICAVSENNEGAVQFLLEGGAKPNLLDSDGFSPLYHAYENPTITQLLLKHGADVNQRNAFGRTALMAPACYIKWNNNIQQVTELLLTAGAGVNCTDDEGRSVLHHFASSPCWFGNLNDIIARISFYIMNGAKVTLKDNQGKTSFDYAQDNGNTQLMEFLSQQVADNKTSDDEPDLFQSWDAGNE